MILTLNNGKLVVNIPVSRNGNFWFENERKRILSSVDSRYLTYTGSINEHICSRRNMIWLSKCGKEFNSKIKYDFNNNLCYMTGSGTSIIKKYSLLQPNVTNFLLNGNEVDVIVELEGLLDKDAPSKPHEEIDFILTCQDDEVKRILLYDRYPEFATMYFEFMPNIEFKQLQEYPLFTLKKNSRSEYKIRTAKENNKVLKLLNK